MIAKKKKTKRKTTKRKGRVLRDDLVIDQITDVAGGVYRIIGKNRPPSLKFPTRSLSNVSYDKKKGYFEIGKNLVERNLNYNTVKTFAQTLRFMSLSKELVERNDFATKRDAYYQSKNWGDARFTEQNESDTCMDDVEALFSVHDVSREELRFYPEDHGGAVAGELIVIDHDSETDEEIEIDCTRFGSGAYTIPASVEHLKFKTKAKFILAIETGGVFQRLNYHKYWRSANCILVELSGVPTRATRRFIRRLADAHKLAVYAFTDCDPYAFANIYRTLKVGSGNAAHISRFFCVPQAHFLGVMPQDIIDHKLMDATHKLTATDIKRAKDALKNDPFFKANPKWQRAIRQQLKMGVRAEQQAFAKWDLNYIIEKYLPSKLKKIKSFLP
ncbi:MAG: DNA topoisomerase IV subunit A [Planctomycetota bacterium]|jgi:DNA topoisomerase-6 subunit A|nr:DNA topoisomerase IV subunit A [Planctomycetota bacterium]